MNALANSLRIPVFIIIISNREEKVNTKSKNKWRKFMMKKFTTSKEKQTEKKQISTLSRQQKIANGRKDALNMIKQIEALDKKQDKVLREWDKSAQRKNDNFYSKISKEIEKQQDDAYAKYYKHMNKDFKNKDIQNNMVHYKKGFVDKAFVKDMYKKKTESLLETERKKKSCKR